MRYTTIDKVVRGVLLQKGYPIHFYVQCLVYAARCFEEISFDSIGNIRSKKLEINEFGEVIIPGDCVDVIAAGLINGQYLQPTVHATGMNRLENFDSNGDRATYGEGEVLNGIVPANVVTWNGHGENVGRRFGHRGRRTDVFQVIPERNVIQFDEQVDADYAVIQYISDGSESDNATMIHPYAIQTLEDYIKWQLKENGRSYSEYDKDRMRRIFEHSHMVLRARMNPLTMDDIRAIIKKNTHGSIK